MSGTAKTPREIFISYSSADAAVANEICEGLESAGLLCWIAPRNIDPGATWTSSLMSAISESRIMVLVFSNATNESGHVLREIHHSMEKRLQVFPIRVENVVPTGGLAYCLVGVQWFDATARPMAQHIPALAARLRLLLEHCGEALARPPVSGNAGATTPSATERPRDVYFQCDNCGQRLVVDAAAAGQNGECPACQSAFTVPDASRGPQPAIGMAHSRVPSAPILDPAGVAQLKATFATFLGPMAKVLVDRALPKAGSVSELIDQLAAELDSPDDRERFKQAVTKARQEGPRGR